MQIGNDWDEILQPVLDSENFKNMMQWIHNERESKDIYPPEEDMFNALKYTSYTDTKVVILGQDPYIKEGQAHGFAFSVNPGVNIPPSLMNIFQEIHDELGCYIPDNGCLIPWAKQGVLLLNSIMTVEANRSLSHAGIGWESLTNYIIQSFNTHPTSIVFMLWGNKARQKAELIDQNSNLVLQAAHPSPLAMGKFFGCGHFLKCNQYLYDIGVDEIDWQIPNIEG